MAQFIDHIIAPYFKKTRADLQQPDLPAVLIYDAFRAHATEGIQNKVASLNARLIMVPKNMTDHLQPFDISVNKPAKNVLTKRYSEWYMEQVVELEENGDPDYESLGKCNLD